MNWCRPGRSFWCLLVGHRFGNIHWNGACAVHYRQCDHCGEMQRVEAA